MATKIVEKIKKTESWKDLERSSRERHEYLQKRSPAYKKSAVSKAKEELKNRSECGKGFKSVKGKCVKINGKK